jgi:riboflavin kinase / FMN adenylyltransferase
MGKARKSISGCGKLMEIIDLRYPIDPHLADREIVLALGYFDGVHLGHQAVIREAQRLAHELGVVFAVMTFDPHPRNVLGKGRVAHYLTPLPEKLRQFSKLGVERTYMIKFDLPFSALSKEQFVEQVLLPLQVRGVTTGFNFTFGHGAAGTVSDLAQLGKGWFQTRVVQPVCTDGVTVSSTYLRTALATGEMERVKRLLGRNYRIVGKVVRGSQRGRRMGFPTANLQLEAAFLLPRRGVYVVQAEMAEGKRAGMLNIGVRPTFAASVLPEQAEVHLFDFAGNLYQQKLSVAFLHFIREEKKFPSVDALIAQIDRDQVEAKRWLREGDVGGI